MRGTAIKKVKCYYQEVAWGALSGILDHVILWWSREALATHHNHGAQHLKDWLRQFIQGNESETYFMIKYFFNNSISSGRNCSILCISLKFHSPTYSQTSVAKFMRRAWISHDHHRLGPAV